MRVKKEIERNKEKLGKFKSVFQLEMILVHLLWRNQIRRGSREWMIAIEWPVWILMVNRCGIHVRLEALACATYLS
jgi:hypothetical protein